jgi:tetratricopeptide (TPR) repeat protein
MDSENFYEARTCFEDGLALCSGDDADGVLKSTFSERIVSANHMLAVKNLHEAEYALSHGDADKAADHLELVKTLSYDQTLRGKAEILLLSISKTDGDHGAPVSVSSCASCSGSSVGECTDSTPSDDSLPPLEYYELLIQQLPADQYQRYSELGEKFAYAYIAASHDEHHEALSGLEACCDILPQDIYWYEKGKVLHRLGNDDEAEKYLRRAIQLNGANSLAWFTLAHLLRECNNFHDALTTVDLMITGNMLPEQAMMLRGEIFEVTGNHESAINQYAGLLQTPYARAAAEKLYGILIEIGRHNDAAVIFKKYLNKSCH